MESVQQIQELTAKLEFAHQEIRNIRLEKIELEKEIIELQQQNDELIQENKSYLESSQMDQQQISILHSISIGVNEVNLYNEDLNFQISDYEKLVKNVKSQNINLLKENEKYKNILEEINESKHKKDEIYINNTLNLENKIKDLENECDELREEINKINILNSLPMSPQQTQYSYSTSTKYKEIPFCFQMKSISTKSVDNKTLFTECGNKSYSKYMQTEIISYNYDNGDIMDQLLKFGYNEYEINIAINKVHDKGNINDIVEALDNIIGNNINCKCQQYHKEIQWKIAEINKLNVINDDNKCIINALQKEMKILSIENEKLQISKKENANNGCIAALRNLFS